MPSRSRASGRPSASTSDHVAPPSSDFIILGLFPSLAGVSTIRYRLPASPTGGWCEYDSGSTPSTDPGRVVIGHIGSPPLLLPDPVSDVASLVVESDVASVVEAVVDDVAVRGRARGRTVG